MRLHTTILFLFFVFTLSAQENKPWKEFISVDGKFRITTPGEMIEKVNEIETEIGDFTYFSYIYQNNEKDAENLVYKVSYVDYPEYTIHSDSTDFVEEFFHSTIETSIQSVHGNLRYADEIKMLEYPGRIWRVDYNKGHDTIKTKAFIVGRRYYQIQVVGHRAKSLNRVQDRFFDSFYLIE